MNPWPADRMVSRLEPGVRPQQQRDEPRHDRSVARRGEVQLPFSVLSVKPDLRLTAANLVLVGQVLRRELGKLASEVDDVLVAIHPIFEEFELLNDLAMNLLDGSMSQAARPNLGF